MLKSKNIDYIHFDTIDSTNTWAKNNAHLLNHRGFTCITAEEQTQGRGCREKRWISPRGQNIYATLFFCLPKDFSHLDNLGQIMCFSCARILKEMGFDTKIKWPNDILIEEKKIAGVLCEVTQIDDQLGIAIGIGINVNMTEEMLQLIDQPASSLAQLSTHTWNLEQILNPLLLQFIADLETLTQFGFSPFQKPYQEILIIREKYVEFKNGDKKYKGSFHSISDEGKLIISLPDGETITLTSSQIQI